MSPHGRVHGGSRDPTHAVPPRTNLKCRFCSGSGYGYGYTATATATATASTRPRSPLNTRPVILRLSRRPRGH